MVTQSPRQQHLETVIFGTGTLAGRRFDIALIVLILLSVTVVVLDSVPELNQLVGDGFWYAEVVLPCCSRSNTPPECGARTIAAPTC